MPTALIVAALFVVSNASVFADYAAFGDSVFLHDTSPASGTFHVPQWNPLGHPGTVLNSVDVTLHEDLGLIYEATSPAGTTTQLMTFTGHGNFDLYLADHSTLLTSLAMQQGQDQVVPGYPIDASQPPPNFAVIFSFPGETTLHLVGASDLLPFVGAGTMSLPIDGEGGIDPQWGLSTNYPYPFAGHSTLTVAYSWSPVPEPDGFVLAIVGGVGMAVMFWHRSRPLVRRTQLPI